MTTTTVYEIIILLAVFALMIIFLNLMDHVKNIRKWIEEEHETAYKRGLYEGIELERRKKEEIPFK